MPEKQVAQNVLPERLRWKLRPHALCVKRGKRLVLPESIASNAKLADLQCRELLMGAVTAPGVSTLKKMDSPRAHFAYLVGTEARKRAPLQWTV